jgi:phosphatidylglycerol:prolipoprotein diacylglycerol transferase
MRIKAVRDRAGIVSGIFLIGYAAFRSFVEFFREPDEQLGFLFNAVTMGQVLSIPMVLAGLGFIIYALRRPIPAP